MIPAMYSIKAVSQATGLSVETLRAWERRYGVVVPKRDDLGRRAYSPEDVLRLRRLREATDRGHPISRLSQLADEALADLLEDRGGEPPGTAASGAFVERILEAVRKFDAVECEQSLTLAIAMLPPAQLIGEVLAPLLREVGERWHGGDLSIAQERLVSSAVRKHVSLVLDTYDRAARRPALVFATLPGERHEFGLLMSALVCASHGFKVHYLGVDLPPAEIARYAAEVRAVAIAVSVVMLDSVQDVPRHLEELAQAAGTGVQVWLGGSGTQALGSSRLPAGCSVIRDERELAQCLAMLDG